MTSNNPEDQTGLQQQLAATEALREGWEALQLSLRNQGQLLHYLTQYAPAAVAMLDTSLHYMLVSHRWKTLFRLEDKPLIELPFTSFFTKVPERMMKHLRQGLDGISSSSAEAAWTHPDGELDWLRWNTHPWYDARGDIGGVIVGVEVMTAEKKLSLKLEELNQNLEQKVADRTQSLEQLNEELRGFAHNVSHDLRTPLVNVTGFLKELEWSMDTLRTKLQGNYTTTPEIERLLQKDIPESLAYLDIATKQMDRLLGALRRLASMGHANLEVGQVDVHALVERICESQAHIIQQNNVDITVEPLPTIVTDYLALSQIFNNLISNSLKYLDADRPGVIKISGLSHENHTDYLVQDNGLGISIDKQEMVFHPFTRLSGLNDASGEGMGLAFVKTLVRKLEGKITCSSNAEHGTTFTLSLPHRKPIA
ncbi:MAG: ATP-binding protein [Bacteroidia bacterium]